jgi:hypothetical protein
VQWILYRQRIEEDYKESCRIRALVERKFKADKWQQRKRLPPRADQFAHIPTHHKRSLFAKLHHKFDIHGNKLDKFNKFLSKYDWLYLGDVRKIDFSSYVYNLFSCSHSSREQEDGDVMDVMDGMYDQRTM